jgi:LysM repeat protein
MWVPARSLPRLLAGQKIITPVRYNHFMRKAWLAVLLLCAACGPVPQTAVPAAGNLKPYATMAPSATPDAAAALIRSSESVVPTPTPFAYKVKAGDTMGQIAERFNVDLDALLAANPEVDPNSMRVGDTLQIPSNPKNTTGEPTPTPAPFAIEQVACHATANGGLWCFALAHNDTTDAIEDVTARVTLLDSKGTSVTSPPALLPLDILPPGASLPLSVFFSPGLPSGARPQVQVLTAIRLLPNDARYLDAAVQNTQVQVDWSGLSGQGSGQVHLSDLSKPAHRIWIAAVVYDDAGNVTGVRRWETSTVLQPGSDMPFSLGVASLAGEIARVDFVVEARP